MKWARHTGNLLLQRPRNFTKKSLNISTNRYNTIFVALNTQIEEALHMLPQFLREIIAKYGSAAALEFTYFLTKGYTPSYFFEELQGFADGSGVDYMQVVRLHMFPELIKASCSMAGAWGPATQKTPNGKSLITTLGIHLLRRASPT